MEGGSGNIGVFNRTSFSLNVAKGRDVASGGGAWINGGVTFQDCEFRGNRAESDTLNSLEYNSGGGIYVQRSARDSEEEVSGVAVRRGGLELGKLTRALWEGGRAHMA